MLSDLSVPRPETAQQHGVELSSGTLPPVPSDEISAGHSWSAAIARSSLLKLLPALLLSAPAEATIMFWCDSRPDECEPVSVSVYWHSRVFGPPSRNTGVSEGYLYPPSNNVWMVEWSEDEAEHNTPPIPFLPYGWVLLDSVRVEMSDGMVSWYDLGPWSFHFDHGLGQLWQLWNENFTGCVANQCSGSEPGPLEPSARPNPFNPTTTISWVMPEAAEAQIEVFNIRGELVGEMPKEHVPAGANEWVFNADNLPSGAYVYRISSADRAEWGKLLLLR